MLTPERPVLPDHPTKQQLDELDALMERMLALPVNQPEEFAPAAKLASLAALAKEENNFASKSRQGTAAEDRIESAVVPEAPILQDIIVATPSVSVSKMESPPAPHPGQTFLLQTLQPKTDLPEMPDLKEIKPGAVTSLQPSPKHAARSEQRPTFVAPPVVANSMQPVIWCNRMYDSGTAKMGSPGSWLRGTRGRTFVGLTGIALLAAALAWVAIDSWGWTW